MSAATASSRASRLYAAVRRVRRCSEGDALAASSDGPRRRRPRPRAPLYGPQKAAWRARRRGGRRSRALIVRPGLIVGPGDRTGRFSHWPWRALGRRRDARPRRERRRADPADSTFATSPTGSCAPSRTTRAAVYNATGPQDGARLRLARSCWRRCIDAARRRGGAAAAQIVPVGEAFLRRARRRALERAAALACRRLIDHRGFARVDCRRAVAAGLRHAARSPRHRRRRSSTSFATLGRRRPAPGAASSRPTANARADRAWRDARRGSGCARRAKRRCRHEDAGRDRRRRPGRAAASPRCSRKAGVETVVLERRSADYVLGRIRAGVLEQVTVDLLDAGRRRRAHACAKACRTRGIELCFGGARHRIDFHAPDRRQAGHGLRPDRGHARPDGRCARPAASLTVYEAEGVSLHGFDGARPVVRYTHGGRPHELACDFIAGCDGYHGVSRQSVPAGALHDLRARLPVRLARRAVGDAAGLARAHLCQPRARLRPVQHALGDAQPLLRAVRARRRRRALERRRVLGRAARCASTTTQPRRLVTGPSIEKSIAPLRSFVAEPMRFGRLFLAGDAAHIVPPTGAKGLNLAAGDVGLLARALRRALPRAERRRASTRYSARCLRRVWRAERFSWWFTSLMHQFPGDRRVRPEDAGGRARLPGPLARSADGARRELRRPAALSSTVALVDFAKEPSCRTMSKRSLFVAGGAALLLAAALPVAARAQAQLGAKQPRPVPGHRQRSSALEHDPQQHDQPEARVVGSGRRRDRARRLRSGHPDAEGRLARQAPHRRRA